MQRHRFYAPPAQINHSQITLNEDEAHHLTRVLRLNVGAQVFAFDGLGNEYDCAVTQADKRTVTLAIKQQLADVVESPLQLTLAQALVKGDKFDLIVQKAVELGVTRIVPLITENSDIRKAEERAENKFARWQRIALEATKQCGRRRLLELKAPLALAEFCAQEKCDERWLLAERDGYATSFGKVTGLNSLAVAVGPEGGWSDEELAVARQHQFKTIQLGPRILRTETAAIVAATLAQAFCGDL